MTTERIRQSIREVPDFPKPGILFYDITTVLSDPEAFGEVVDRMVEGTKDSGAQHVLGIESRGFLFGAPMALQLGLPFAPIRKRGKLPHKTVRADYALEYGTDSLEMHVDAVSKGDRVVIVDDLLATGGTAEAAARLVEGQGAEVVGMLFFIELDFLKGRAKLGKRPVKSLLVY